MTTTTTPTMPKKKKGLILVICLLLLTAIGLILGFTLRDKEDETLNQATAGPPTEPGTTVDPPEPNPTNDSMDDGEEVDGTDDGEELEGDGDFTDPAPPVLPTAKVWPHEESDVPLDPDIRFGTLENGFRYMILKNKEPQEEVALRMHVDAGSYHEDDDQLGLAHYLEHMMFNGISGYESVEELISTMQNLGIDFGKHLNAYTSFGETVYLMQLRDNTTTTLDICFGIMRGWMDGALFKEEEVENERGIVLSELLTRDSAGYRMTQELLDFLVPYTLLPKRWPIGTEEVISALTREEFVEFYTKFYTPDRMTYVVVGDIDPDEIEPLIIDTFANMTNPEELGMDPDYGSVETGTGFRTKVITDDEFGYNEVYLYSARNFVSLPDTVENRIDRLSIFLADRILTRRLQLLAKEENTPISYGNIGTPPDSVWGSVVDFPYFLVRPVEGRLQEGVMVLEQEFRRFMEYGILPYELEDAKAVILNSYEESVERKGTRRSDGLATRLVKSVEGRFVVASPEENLRIAMEAMEVLTPERVHEDFYEYWNTTDIALVHLTDEVNNEELTEQLLETYWNESKLIPVDPPADSSDVTFGYTDFGTPGTIVSDSKVEDLDIRQLVLSNNVRVNMKTTDFSDNSVIFTVRFGSGRLSQPAAVGLEGFAGTVINAGGLGLHSVDELRRLTAGKTFGISFTVNDDHFSFSGGTNPADMELALQLLTAHLSDPGYRDEAVRIYRHAVPSFIDDLEHTLNGPFAELASFLKGGDARFGFETEAQLLSYEAEDARDWLEPEFANTYLELSIVGEIPDSAIDYILNTIGALPTRAEAPNTDLDNDLIFPDTPQSITFTYESDLPASAAFVAWEIQPLTEETINVTRASNLLAKTFKDRMRAQIREELGAAYAYAAVSLPRSGFDHGEFLAYAIVAPENATMVLDRIQTIASNLVQDGITEDELHRAATPFYEDLEDTLRSNGYWLNTVMDGCQANPYYLDWSRNRGAFYESVTTADVDELADNYLPLDKAIEGQMLPLASGTGRNLLISDVREHVQKLKLKSNPLAHGFLEN